MKHNCRLFFLLALLPLSPSFTHGAEKKNSNSELHKRQPRDRGLLTRLKDLKMLLKKAHAPADHVVTQIPETETHNNQEIVEAGMSPIEKYWFRRKTLHNAAEAGDFEVVKHLIERDKDLLQTDYRGRTPLHSAAKGSNLALVKYLVEKAGILPLEKDKDRATALHYAAEAGGLVVVRYLIEKAKVTSGEKDERGLTPLHYAAKAGSLAVVKYLVEKAGIPPLEKDDGGATALHYAAETGGLVVVRYLIEKAKVTSGEKDERGLTPLHHAAKAGGLALVKYLVEKAGIPPLEKDNGGATALHYAAAGGDLPTVQYLVGDVKGINPNQEDMYDDTPLHKAAAAGKTDVVQWLVEKGQCTPSLYSVNQRSLSPLMCAIEAKKGVTALDLLEKMKREEGTIEDYYLLHFIRYSIDTGCLAALWWCLKELQHLDPALRYEFINGGIRNHDLEAVCALTPLGYKLPLVANISTRCTPALQNAILTRCPLELITYLIKILGADPNEEAIRSIQQGKGPRRYNALGLALAMRSKELVRSLVAAGAHFTKEDMKMFFFLPTSQRYDKNVSDLLKLRGEVLALLVGAGMQLTVAGGGRAFRSFLTTPQLASILAYWARTSKGRISAEGDLSNPLELIALYTQPLVEELSYPITYLT